MKQLMTLGLSVLVLAGCRSEGEDDLMGMRHRSDVETVLSLAVEEARRYPGNIDAERAPDPNATVAFEEFDREECSESSRDLVAEAATAWAELAEGIDGPRDQGVRWAELLEGRPGDPSLDPKTRVLKLWCLHQSDDGRYVVSLRAVSPEEWTKARVGYWDIFDRSSSHLPGFPQPTPEQLEHGLTRLYSSFDLTYAQGEAGGWELVAIGETHR